MYSRVKRKKRKTVHTFFTRRISRDGGSMADTEDTDQNGLSDSDTIEDQSDLERGKDTSKEISTDIFLFTLYFLLLLIKIMLSDVPVSIIALFLTYIS